MNTNKGSKWHSIIYITLKYTYMNNFPTCIACMSNKHGRTAMRVNHQQAFTCTLTSFLCGVSIARRLARLLARPVLSCAHCKGQAERQSPGPISFPEAAILSTRTLGRRLAKRLQRNYGREILNIARQVIYNIQHQFWSETKISLFYPFLPNFARVFVSLDPNFDLGLG